MAANPIMQNVYIIDDDAALRDASITLLESVGLPALAFDSAAAFLGGYDKSPGVVVLDVRMPSVSGLELQAELTKRGYTQLAIIFVSGYADVPMAVDALKHGAVDFLQKPYRDQDLLDCIHEAMESNQSDQQQKLESSEIDRRIDALTPREREVMGLVADGKPNKLVGAELNISQRTVEVHRARLMQKMGVRALPKLVRMLDRVGYFESTYPVGS